MGEPVWTGRSRGGDLGHALIHLTARLGGATCCHALTLLPATWLFCTMGRERRASCAWWARARPHLGRWGRLFQAWCHFTRFARLLADRILVSAAPGSLRFAAGNRDALESALACPGGCILLSAHLGNWELAGRFVLGLGRPLVLAMADGEDPRIAARVRSAAGLGGAEILDLRAGPAAAAALAGALGRGAAVGMLGDRSLPGQPLQSCPLLGHPAPLPLGPFLAAAATGAAILPVFCLKLGPRRYGLLACGPWRVEGSRAGRQAAAVEVCRRWGRLLDAVARRWPQQWHNFHPVWSPRHSPPGGAP